MIRWATWSWTTVPRFAGFSTMTGAVRSTRPGCEWPTRWTRSGSRSNGTWTRKGGVRGEATEPVGRLHRQGIGPGETPTEDDPVPRRDDPGGGRDPGPGGEDIGPASVRLRRDPGPPRRRQRSDPRADGGFDAELPCRPLCWR